MLATVGVSATSLTAATSGAANQTNISGIELYYPDSGGGILYVGKSNAVATSGALTAGMPLYPGKAMHIPPGFAKDTDSLFIISDTAAQSLNWIMIQ